MGIVNDLNRPVALRNPTDPSDLTLAGARATLDEGMRGEIPPASNDGIVNADEEMAKIMADFYDKFHETGDAPQALAEVQRDWLVKLRKEHDLPTAAELSGPFILIALTAPCPMALAQTNEGTPETERPKFLPAAAPVVAEAERLFAARDYAGAEKKYLDLANGPEALAVARQAERARLKTLANILSFTSEQQRLDYLEASGHFFHLFATLGHAPETALANLRQKGLVLDTLAEDRLAAQASGNPDQRLQIDQLRRVKQRLTQLLFFPTPRCSPRTISF